MRYRDVRFWRTEDDIVGLSDETGEVEVVCGSSSGKPNITQLTRNSAVLRLECLPSPSGVHVAYNDKNQQL